ncbi:MAG: cytochrome c biogenesis protein ResB, partial [Acidithiobacillus ferrivorans]
MRLAVSLLVLLAIASIIGTILNQQQPYEDYALKF